MKTIEFLSKVLAPEDNYLLWMARSSGATWNENYADINDCIKAIETTDQKEDITVYMAIGAYTDNVHEHAKTKRDYVQRRSYQATYFKSLAADLDVGEREDKYDSQREAVKSIIKACKRLKLPLPMVVLSGNGVHVYWPFDKSISAENWERMSLALRAALESQGVKLDVSKISDRTMVLRPVGSHHKKDPDNWKEVKVVMDAPERPVMEYAKALKPFASSVKKGRKSNKGFAKRQSAVMDALLESGSDINIEHMARCPQLEAMLSSAGVSDATGGSVSEPLWRAALGIAKFCEDKEDAAIRLSNGHPDFEYNDCMEKMNGWSGTGPTVCATFEKYCPEPCESCEHRGKITSPAQLTGGVTEVEVELPDTEETETVSLPNGYSFKNKCLYYRHPKLDEDIFVSPYMMWVVSRVTDYEGDANSALIAVEFPREGVKVITIDSVLIAVGGNDLRKALAAKQVYIKEDIEPLRNYLMTFLRKLQSAVAADISYTHFGWQKDGSFLLGDRVIGGNVKGRPHLDGIAKMYKERLSAKGDLETWIEATRIFDLPGMEFQNFAFFLALGAPLLEGAHFPSALVNLYSGDSGSGKTLTGKFGISAWGNPETLGGKAKDTEAAFYKNFGTLNSIGAYVDEMTTMDTDQLRRFVMCIQDGMEKERLNKEANGFRPQAKWRMPIITSSNKDMYDQLGKGVASEAEELRILQLSCPRVPYLEEKGTKVGYKLQILLERNHGLAGPILVNEIIQQGGPQRVYEAMSDLFDAETKFVFKGQERFYRGLVVVAYAAGRICQELGLVRCNPMRGVTAVKKEVLVLRGSRKHQAHDGFDVLAQFLTEKQSEIVFYTNTPTNSYALQPVPRSAVARVELTMDAKERMIGGMIYVNRTGFRKWGARNGAEARSTIEKMRKAGAIIEEHTRKTLYKGVQGASASGQTHCFAIDVMSHARLIAACDESKPEPDAIAGRNRLEEIKND
jgi:hypothetical protein